MGISHISFSSAVGESGPLVIPVSGYPHLIAGDPKPPAMEAVS